LVSNSVFASTALLFFVLFDIMKRNKLPTTTHSVFHLI
jgi:hypothetical protein